MSQFETLRFYGEYQDLGGPQGIDTYWNDAAEMEDIRAMHESETRAENAWLTQAENSGFYDDPR